MRTVMIGGLLIALAVALFLSPLASQSPDGLERVAEEHGFMDRAAGKAVHRAPVPDYAVPGMGNPILFTALSGLIGTLAAFGMALMVAGLLRARAERDRPSAGPREGPN